jgi:hypothetical protein
MSEAVEGVIHGRMIELEIDPGLQDGERVEVVIRRAERPEAGREGARSAAGSLAHFPPEYFEDLDEIVRARKQWPYREPAE